MSPEVAILAEKVAAVERHLKRVVECLPATAEELRPMTDASDAVILHLWQAVQIVIDMAVSACVRLGHGAPASYWDAFRKLATAGVIDSALADRLTRAAGFRNVVAHAYEAIDMARVFQSATQGAQDLRAFLAASAKLAEAPAEKK
jgi:uncharacterized protein YutE (UPF0331/DUF86 family)